jgi:hypothetical protein
MIQFMCGFEKCDIISQNEFVAVPINILDICNIQFLKSRRN